MEGIHEILNTINRSSEGDVLATVAHVEGSAYRKEGATMLFRKDGSTVGMISAGCLETDLVYRVQELRKEKTAQLAVYDMREESDLSWGQGAGCNGRITVLLEPIDACLREHLCRLKYHLDCGNPVTLVKKLANDDSVSDYIFMTEDQSLYGKWHGHFPAKIKELKTKFQQECPKNGMIFSRALEARLFFQSFEPKPRLLVFGAGPDAVPLVRLASQAGFSVIVSDWRSDFCNEKNFSEAEQLVVGFPSEVISKLPVSHHDSVLILTHHFQKDKELLTYFIGKELKFLGVLGPRTRTKRLLEGKAIPSKISSPVGLPIGAEGPEEIAISIIAELIQCLRSKRAEKVVCS